MVMYRYDVQTGVHLSLDREIVDTDDDDEDDEEEEEKVDDT
jgi:hypothetical protein